jgi:ABC-type Fe3+ transport system permease subunit
MEGLEGFELLAGIVTVLAAVLLFVSILACRRERSWRLMLAGVVFTLFLIKGIILSISIFYKPFENTSQSVVFHLLFDVIILLFLFFAVLSPPKSWTKSDTDLGDNKGGKS